MSSGNDAKFFQRGKVHELQAELQDSKKDLKYSKRKQTLKKIIANMTMGNDMSALSAEMLSCLTLPDIEIKKMVYLFIVTYCKYKPDIAVASIPSITRDSQDENPLIRSLAIRNFSNMQVEQVYVSFCEPLRRALVDKDPYVCKTAAISVAKLFANNEILVRREGLLDRLTALLNHGNANVVANAVLALMDIASNSDSFVFSVDVPTANKLLSALDESSEWSQAYLLEAVMTVVPENQMEAELLADRIAPRLQHANPGVVITAVRIIVYLSGFIQKPEQIISTLNKCGPPLVTLLHGNPEMQYIALRNIQLIIQKYRDFLRSEIKVFFCKYNDPIYVKLAKLEIMFQLADENNVSQILPELKEYASEIDVDFVRKSVRAIGRCAVKIEQSADKSVETLVDLIQSKVDYVVQEAVVVIKDIFRKYPNRFESIIRILCENLESLEEPEAKASMIWIIGQYSDRIDNADQLLGTFLDNFKEETSIVQLSLLTAVVKLFIKRPTAGQALVPRVLKYSTEDVDNPDVRDRGFMYWRLLSTDPISCKAIVCGEKPAISTETDNLDPIVLSRLLYSISTLSSLSHRPVKMNPELSTMLLHLFNKSNKLIDTLLKTPKRNSENSKLPENTVPMPNPYKADDYDNQTRTAANNVVSQMDRLILLDDTPANNPVGMYGSLPLDLFSSDYPSPPGGTMENRSISPDLFSMPQQQYQNNMQQPMNGMGNTPYNPYGAQGMNPNQQKAQNLVNNPHNPFANPVAIQQVTPTSSYGSAASPSTGNVNLLNLDSNPNAVIDPFAKSSIQRNTSPVQAVPSNDFASSQGSIGHEAPKSLFMTAANGKGLEILGTFVRRNGIIFMDMTFTNKSPEPIRDCAILLNKNSFALVPAKPLALGVQALMPNQSVNTSLPLKVEGLPVVTTPANNIQVALKNNLGIVYFQTLIPLYVLFKEGGGVDQQTWLQLWREGITSPEFRSGTVFPKPLQMLKPKLESNNFSIVAERMLDGKAFLYGGCTLIDGTVFVAEISVDQLNQGSIANKTVGSHLSPAFNQALILLSL